MARAVILFGHGSRDPQWRAPMDAVAAAMARREPGVQVRCAFLELTEPNLHDCAARLVAAGADRLSIVPMFLGVGRHAREDLPGLVDALRVRFPTVEWVLHAAIGEDARVVDLLARIALE